MVGGGSGGLEEPPDTLLRENLAIAQPYPGLVLHSHEDGFKEEMDRLYTLAESRATERLVRLKKELRAINDIDRFWNVLAKGLVDITGAQMSIVAKRVLIDDKDSAVELPPFGQVGSCMMSEIYHYDDGQGHVDTGRKTKFHAYSCPCAHMRYDKTFIIPDRLDQFIVDNPNAKELPIAAESYIGVPLFAQDKCFAHVAVLWTADGARRRSLSWGFLEMALHSLEDLTLARLLDTPSPIKSSKPADTPGQKVIPSSAITPGQSLKPYARSLSHELRTPMQGIVGMLDIMYATVQEAAEGQKDARLRQVFNVLRENIETVQDSSRRAVEAADNVVHAYDLGMGVPDSATMLFTPDEEPSSSSMLNDEQRDMIVTGNMPISFRGTKRRRESEVWKDENATKVQMTDANRREALQMDEDAIPRLAEAVGREGIVPGLRHTSLRELFQYVINDGLRVGGRPESAIAQETGSGEFIEVRVRSSSGEEKTKTVEWSVDPAVPDTMLVDERDLTKLVSCVFLNAIKFTDQGSIKVCARVSAKSRNIIISISDTGCGIPSEFLPDLFKPFTRQDQSLTRQSEGLGLGLMVAKSLARKLYGDLICVRSETTGPHHGSEFQLRIPLTPADSTSRPGTPSYSPSPSIRDRHHRDVVSLEPDNALLKSPANIHTARKDTSTKLALPTSQPTPLPTPISALGEASSPPLPTTPQLPQRKTSRKSASGRRSTVTQRPKIVRDLASELPLRFLVAEDNRILREVLVKMLRTLGYTTVHQAIDGADAVRQVQNRVADNDAVDVVLMDLWMPYMDGYEATERILNMGAQGITPSSEDGGAASSNESQGSKTPVVLAVTADATDGAFERARLIGMRGFMTKPYRLLDLEKLIVEHCHREPVLDAPMLTAR